MLARQGTTANLQTPMVEAQESLMGLATAA